MEGNSALNGSKPTCKWSLAVIARNCPRDLERMLKSIAAYPDQIVVVNTGIDENEAGFKETNAVAKSFGAEVYHFPWREDFAAARNFSFEKCSNDVVMWLDTDDTVEGADALSRCIRETFGGGHAEVFYMEYLYEFDEAGKCTCMLLRERVVDRRFFEWRAPIHEVLCEKFRARGGHLPPNVSRVIHNRLGNSQQNIKSLERNLRILEHHYLPVEKGGLGEYCEERMVFYWAQTCVGLGKFEEALQKYLEYIPRSGSNAEIQQAFGHASECARILGKIPQAKALAYQAIERNPDAPTPYWFMATAQREIGEWKLVEHYALSCLERANAQQQEMVSNPKVVFGGSAMLAALAKYNLGKYDDVEPLLQIGEKYYPKDDKNIAEIRKNIAEMRRKRDLMQSYVTLRDELEKEGRGDEVRALARATPKELHSIGDVARYLPKHRPADKRSIVFMVSVGMPGGWGPELLKTGIGGSEEAVCYLSEQFALAGWHVEVYADCKRQKWNGVEWYPLAEFPGDDDQSIADVLIVSRNAAAIMEYGSKAKRTYLWLHDTPNPAFWPHGIWDAYDGIFVLSEFHSGIYDFVPSEKKILSANGLSHGNLVPLDQLANEPHRMVYASCPTRGLETVLTWWPEIKKAVPDAELDVYYGFHPTLVAMARGNSQQAQFLAGIIKRVDALRKQPGVNWKGFVGHEELHAGFAKCGLWLYPTGFPEISCITAMKMQAHGVVPVTVNKFALAETVQHGVKIDGDIADPLVQRQWCDEVIKLAKEPWTAEKRLEMAEAARETFDWKKVAEQWAGIFEKHFKAPTRDRVYARNRMDLIRAS